MTRFMKTRNGGSVKFLGLGIAAVWTLALLVGTPAARAAIVQYGTYVGASVQFVDIAEESGTDPVPLYGAPTGLVDSLDFTPTSFNSYSDSGASLSDITDGTLTFTVEALPTYAIGSIEFSEVGDFALVGPGTNVTYAHVQSIVTIDIFQVDGVDITPITLQKSLAFSPDSGHYGLGPTDFFRGGPWQGTLTVDLTAELTGLGIPFAAGVTQMVINANNTLATRAETATSAFIAKKDFDVTVVTIPGTQPIPEPSSCLLAAMALAGLVLGTRRRHSRS